MRKITNIDEYTFEVKLWLQKCEVTDFEKSLITENSIKEAMNMAISPKDFVYSYLKK